MKDSHITSEMKDTWFNLGNVGFRNFLLHYSESVVVQTFSFALPRL